ncbi:MAG: hypothetical protein GXO68_04300 [Crenarchaeota archaeon]|nr:hypothetical protein [Thermoproteota archaeon]
MLIITIKGSRYYACSECGAIYESPARASKCEEWCRNHHSCNNDIVKEAVGWIRRSGLRLK